MEDEEERIKAQEMINVANDFGSDYDADRVFEVLTVPDTNVFG